MSRRHVSLHEPTSYKATGIPCGNPKRYESRGVIRMARDGHPYQDQRLEVPQETIETESERQLKELVQKQLETDVTVDGQLKRKKQFEAVTVYKPATLEVSGTVSLSQYQNLEKFDQHTQNLRQCGLTEDEIFLKLESEGIHKNGNAPRKRRYGVDPESHATQLEQIDKKIQAKKAHLDRPDTVAGARYMSRHEMDLEKAISHDDDKNRVLGMLITSKKPTTDFDHPDDPINHLGSILEEFKQRARKRKRKKRSKSTPEADRNGSTDEPVSSEQIKSTPEEKKDSDSEELLVATCEPRPKLTGPFVYITCTCEDTHSVPDSPLTENQHSARNPLPKLNEESLGHSSYRQSQSPEDNLSNDSEPPLCSCRLTESSKPHGVRLVRGNVQSIPADVIRQYKLSLDMIRDQTRFKDYTPGQPSKTLFLKNLSPKVTEEDLVSLFIRFEKPAAPNIVFRLMSGKMKGQAFVTFDSDEVAAAALELVNGYDFRGKPIIIQYGKRSTALTTT